MKADLHTHTFYSEDSAETIEAYCAIAITRGIDCICITDHIDNNPIDTGYLFYRADDYFKSLNAAKMKFGDRLLILAGCEFSEPHSYPRELEKLRSYPYDIVIGSLHYWYKDMFPSVMVQNNVPLETCWEYYWTEMSAMVRAGGFDVLAHMDFAKRYYGHLLYDEAKIAEIFADMIKNNVVPEVNTSSLRKGLDTAMPDADFMRIYASAGGKYYTTGSDAHFAVDLYADIDRIKAEMSEIGLIDVHFENRKIIIP